MSVQTRQLITNLTVLERGLDELRRCLDTVVRVLSTAEDLLLIPKVVAEKLGLLDAALTALLALLTALSAVPYVGPVANSLARVVEPIQRMVNRASTQAAKIEEQVKPQRKLVSEFRVAFSRLLEPLQKLRQFVGDDLGHLEATVSSNERLPESRYKQASQTRIEAMSAQLLPLTTIPMELMRDSTSTLRTINNSMEGVNALCTEVQTFIEPIVAATKAVEGQSKQAEGITQVLEQRIGPFKVKDALELLSGGKLPKVLADQAKSLLAPFLNKLRSLAPIPPVLQLVPLLMKAADTLGAANRLNQAVEVSLASLTSERNLEQTFASVRP